ncbi:MAG: hypothetical protein ABJB16_10235 [Saprospiraceae bacterium]
METINNGRFLAFKGNNRFRSFVLFSILFGSCWPEFLMAQKDLKPVMDETAALLGDLGGSANKVQRASLTKEDERMVMISLTFAGFTDKSYKVRAYALNNRKEVMQEITPVEVEMPKSKQVDITLNLSEGGKTVSQKNIVSKFLLIRVQPVEGGLTGILESAVGDISLNGLDYVFELDKKWMLMGANVKLNVKLIPYKNAASISPG